MSLRRAFLTYTLGRFGLFLLTAIIAWAIAGLTGHDINGLTLLFLGLVGSTVLSFVMLRPQRDAFALAIASEREAKAQALAAQRARLDDGPST